MPLEGKKKRKSPKQKRKPEKKKSRSKLEREIQKNILKYLEEIGACPARINSGFIFTGKYMIKLAPEGFPDILFFYQGKVHACEVKRPGEQMTLPQTEWRDKLVECGVSHFVAESVDDVVSYLKVSNSL